MVLNNDSCGVTSYKTEVKTGFRDKSDSVFCLKTNKQTIKAFSKGYRRLHLTLTQNTTNQYSRVWVVTPKRLIFVEKCRG